MHGSTERLKVLQNNCTYWVMRVKLSTADVGSAMTCEVHSLNPVCNVHCSMCCTCSFIDDIWNGHVDALQRPNCAVLDKGSVLKNNQLAVLHNIQSVVGDILGHSVYQFINMMAQIFLQQSSQCIWRYTFSIICITALRIKNHLPQGIGYAH